MRLRTSQCFTKLASEFVVESSLLGICYFNGKNREKNSRKANDEFGCNIPKILLEVQGKFIQDHQDIDNATREGFKSVWIEKP